MNVLIVPDEGGQSRRLNLPIFVLKFAGWFMLILALAVIAALLSYSRFALKALDWNRLAAENERLTLENRRVLRVTREVAESRSNLVHLIQTFRTQKKPFTDSLVAAISSGGLSEEASSLLLDQVRSPSQLMRQDFPTLMPVTGFLSQRFLEDPIFPERNHLGLDIAGKEGTPVVAAASGNVIFEGWTSYFGNCLILAHRDGYLTFYGHSSQNLKRLTDEVKRGEPVALLGSTGYSSAPHLHFEVWKDGAPIDPLKVLNLK